ncbi:MAG: HlyD family efflux transporter periplasmic adaptor subunit [Pseudomonadota bacterium]
MEATRSWSGIAELEGRLTRYDDDLQIGAQVQEGDTLFEIDPRDYQIAVAQAEADILRAEADLEDVRVNGENTEASLAIERAILEISKSERDRIQGLVDQGAVATTELDSANQTYLSQQSTVTSLEATLALVAPDTLSSQASLAKAEADLESAQRDLERTEVKAPFAGRVTERGASAFEYARVGDVLVTIEDVSASEVEAAFQPSDLARLIGSVDVGDIIGLAGLEPGDTDFQTVFADVLTAEVVARFGNGLPITWPAEIARITDQIDEVTGAIGIVVRIEGASFPDPASGRPPLVNGGFVEVVLTGPQIQDALLVPERAIRFEGSEAYVYGIEQDDRLARLNVETGQTFGAMVHIKSGMGAGTRLVLSHPVPATVGLLVEPFEDWPNQ